MAEKYGEHPNVIYETFNEPLRDDDWSTELKPYHESVIAAIRAHDPDNLVVLGTRHWDQRPDEAAADPVRAANILYALHFYACTHGEWERSNGDAAIAAGAAVMVSEWGATAADGGRDQIVCEEDTRVWLDWMDQHNLSGAAWRLQVCNDSTCILKTSASPEGNWSDADLHGHGALVRDWMLE